MWHIGVNVLPIVLLGIAPPSQELEYARFLPATTSSMNGFAIDVYHRLGTERDGVNLFFSPYSIYSALALTAEGARGETAQEMGSVLRFPSDLRRGIEGGDRPWSLSTIHAGIAGLNHRLGGGDDEETKAIRKEIAELQKELTLLNREAERLQREEKWEEQSQKAEYAHYVADRLNELLPRVDRYEIRVANALWGEKTYSFRQEFVDTAQKYYETGGVFPVDFQGDPEGARERINQWVEEQTNDRIQDLVPVGMIDAYTALVLTNAIYFKGEWSEPFAEEKTRDRDFTLADGALRKIAMMHAERLKVGSYAAFNADGSFFETPKEIPFGKPPKNSAKAPAGPKTYPDEDGFAMIELPYKGGELSMVVLAPNRHDGLPDLESRLSADSLNQWVKRLEQRNLDVSLPKFGFETSYSLKQTLIRLGMARAFTGEAQFEGLFESVDLLPPTYIKEVLHKAFIEVHEKGTEAAAATAVVAQKASAIAEMSPFIPVFRADRPFLFLIRDTTSGAILFLGRVMQPEAS